MGESLGATGVLARFITERPAGTACETATVTALIDTVAVAVAGCAADAAKTVTQWLDEEERTPGPAAVWGAGEFRSPASAALVNGTAAHALDWDDAVPSMAMHPAAVLFPALLAQAARWPGASGAELLAAYDTGNAVLRAVTELAPDAVHYGRGWHTTATVGRLAATAAAARLARLDETRTRHALGIAASCAAGSIANFGTMTKPLHAGLAARDAVAAVALAGRGCTSNEEQLEHPKGFFAQYGSASAADEGFGEKLAERLEHWGAHWPEDWAIKRYPSCYGTHRSIDAARWLRAEAGFPPPEEIEAVRVSVHAGGLRPLIGHLPRTGLEGKFSMPYTVAVTLLRGTVRLADFTDDALDGTLADPAAAALMTRVAVTEVPGLRGAEVELTLRGGRRVARRAEVTRGDSRDPLTPSELDDKAREALNAAGWTADEADTLAGGLRDLVRAPDLDGLQQLLANGGTA